VARGVVLSLLHDKNAGSGGATRHFHEVIDVSAPENDIRPDIHDSRTLAPGPWTTIDSFAGMRQKSPVLPRYTTQQGPKSGFFAETRHFAPSAGLKTAG
jgi:hypothetical protein